MLKLKNKKELGPISVPVSVLKENFSILKEYFIRSIEDYIQNVLTLPK